jgi:hypothetical protein
MIELLDKQHLYEFHIERVDLSRNKKPNSIKSQ